MFLEVFSKFLNNDLGKKFILFVFFCFVFEKKVAFIDFGKVVFN